MRTEIEIPFSSAKAAGSAFKALQSEVEFQKRAHSSISLNENVLVIKIEAPDIASLHATASSFFRALKVLTAVQKGI